MKSRIFKTIISAAFLALALAAAQPAKAITIYTLTTGNSAISGYSGPYGTVSVSLTDSGTANITFTAAAGYVFGGQGVAAVNVNAASWTIGSFSGVPASSGPLSDGGANTEDGFGTFNQTVDSFDGYNSAFTSLSFKLTSSLGTWGSDSSVLAAISGGWFVATHVFVVGPNGALATGYAAGVEGGGGPGAPDGGSTVVLLGCALAGIGAVGRKICKA
jgi:hypothetical protein